MRARFRAAALLSTPMAGFAATPTGLTGIVLNSGKSGPSLSVPMQIVLALTLLTLLPAAIMSITPFLRITVVLHFLRQALGTQTTPSNQILVGLSLFLTLLIMRPVAVDIYAHSWQPLEQGQLSSAQALEEAAKPLKALKFDPSKIVPCS